MTRSGGKYAATLIASAFLALLGLGSALSMAFLAVVTILNGVYASDWHKVEATVSGTGTTGQTTGEWSQRWVGYTYKVGDKQFQSRGLSVMPIAGPILGIDVNPAWRPASQVTGSTIDAYVSSTYPEKALLDIDPSPSVIALLALVAAFGAVSAGAARKVGALVGPIVLTTGGGVVALMAMTFMNVFAWLMATDFLLRFVEYGRYGSFFFLMGLLTVFAVGLSLAWESVMQGNEQGDARLDLATKQVREGDVLQGSVLLTDAEAGEKFRVQLVFDAGGTDSSGDAWCEGIDVLAVPAEGDEFRLAFSFTVPTGVDLFIPFVPRGRWKLRVYSMEESGVVVPYEFRVRVQTEANPFKALATTVRVYRESLAASRQDPPRS